jgi:hypothetical protein
VSSSFLCTGYICCFRIIDILDMVCRVASGVSGVLYRFAHVLMRATSNLMKEYLELVISYRLGPFLG